MNNCKHKAIIKTTFEELEEELNKFSEQENTQVIATQIFHKESKWYAMCYYKKQGV